MKKIDSFTIDHLTLMPGVYVSRRDVTPSGDHITTFDVRLTAPNREPSVKPEALHTIEHLAATFLRNHPQWAPAVVYWGPMGCCTGSYLILQGHLLSRDILELMRETFAFIADFEGDIPGATAKDCGNYLFNDLQEAKNVARRFLDEVLIPAPAARFEY